MHATIFNRISDTLTSVFPCGTAPTDDDLIKIAGVLNLVRTSITGSKWKALISDSEAIADVVYAVTGANCDLITNHPEAYRAVEDTYLSLDIEEAQNEEDALTDLRNLCDDAIRVARAEGMEVDPEAVYAAAIKINEDSDSYELIDVVNRNMIEFVALIGGYSHGFTPFTTNLINDALHL